MASLNWSIKLWIIQLATAAAATTSAFEPLPSNLTLNISSRPVLVQFPPCLNQINTTSSQLLLSLHALGATAKLHRSMDHFITFAEDDQRRGKMCAALVYPRGKLRAWGPLSLSGYAWNAGGCCPNSKGVDDVAFLSEVIQQVRSILNSRRPTFTGTFIVGVSNGGMMVNRLACELNDTYLLGVSAVSGPLVLANGQNTKDICDRTSHGLPPLPILHVHGLHDPIVPFGGCNSTWSSFGHACIVMHKLVKNLAPFPNITKYVEGWRRRNGQKVDTPKITTFVNRTVTCESTGGTKDNVTLCTASQEGHAWPGATIGCMMPQLNCTQDVDASTIIWNFFERLIV
jgi:poly(3-hydroxybutyrate) depolymerase